MLLYAFIYNFLFNALHYIKYLIFRKEENIHVRDVRILFLLVYKLYLLSFYFNIYVTGEILNVASYI